MAIPAVLYKYHAVTPRTIGSLAARRVWFAKPTRFNDPFDCRVPVVHESIEHSEINRLYELARKESGDSGRFDAQYGFLGPKNPPVEREIRTGVLAAWQNQMQRNQDKGICCLTEKNDDILMWAHYADGHRGICLGFKTAVDPFDKVHPVQYSEVFPQLSPTSFLVDQNDEAFSALVLTKSSCWSYEKEWRAFHVEGDKPYGYAKDVLQSIYFGLAMPQDQQIAIAKLMAGTGTSLYRMQKHPSEFAVVSESCSFTPTP